MDLVFELCMIVFEWDEFRLESFWNYTSLSLSIYIHARAHTHTYLIKFNATTFKYKIYSVEVDLYYLK